MPAVIASYACGFVFGLGLLISGMTQPQKVLAFLDVLGPWDPTMGFVMAAAFAVTMAGYALVRRRASPLFATKHLWPTRTDIDGPLTIGAMLFGAGWGLVGLCPGPALVNLATLSPQVIVFVVAMGVGMLVHDLGQRRLVPAGASEEAVAESANG